MSIVQVVEGTSGPDSFDPIQVADAMCPEGMVAIGGGGAVIVPMGEDNEDIGIDVLEPIDDGGNPPAPVGWRAQATNFFVDSGFNWSVRAFAICATVQ